MKRKPSSTPSPIAGPKPADRPKETENDERVITPAGPLPKAKIHPVKRGETVRRNPDGTFSVVPKEPDKGDQENS